MTELRLGRWRVPTIGVILLLYVMLALVYSQVVPLGEAPDEAPHFTVIRYIATHGRLPSTQEEHEAFQPPLYYLLGAGLTSWADYDGYVIKANADFSLQPGMPKNLLLHTAEEAFPYRGWALTWHVLRLFSILLGGVTIWATYHLGLAVFPGQPAIATGMALLNAFTPEFLFMSGLVNNDNLAAALSALLLLQMVRLIRGHDRWPDILSLGILLGLGVLSKVSVGLAAMPIGVALLYRAWQREGPGRPAIRRGLAWGSAVAGVTLAISGWWFVRNYILHQDLTGWSFILQTNALREGPLTPAVVAWLVKGLFKSFWLAWIGIELSGWLYGVLLVVCLVAAAGLVRLGLRRHALGRDTRAILALLLLHIALVFGSLLQWTATVLGTDQARLLYPALPALLLFLVLGLSQWVPTRRGQLAAGVLGGSFLALAVAVPWAYIAPVHAPPATLTEDKLPADAVRCSLDFGDALRLVAYRIESPEAHPGGAIEMDLYWMAMRPIDEDLWLTLSLVTASGDPIVSKDGSPSAGRDTTDRWTPGPIIPSRHRLAIPEGTAAGEYTIRAGIHPFGTWEWLSVDGRPWVELEGVRVF